jgi:CheY-like chemotaxis protein
VGKVDVRVARTPREGLSILSTSTFDAIVLDYDMPEIDGLSFLKILRSRRDMTPVIFFTGVGREHAAIEALNYGADFYVKKGENPEEALRAVLERIEQAADGRIAGRPAGAALKMLMDMVNFSSDPCFAIDSDGNVIAWNEAIAGLTGIPGSGMIRRGGYSYAEPFFGRKDKMLIDLVLEPDEEIQKRGYLLVSRVKKGPVVAVTKGVRPDGQVWTLWMKAMPLYDIRDNRIATIETVRDITATVKDLPIPEPSQVAEVPQVRSVVAAGPVQVPGAGLFDRILGKAAGAYKDGVLLYARDLNYRDAIAAFDRAIAVEPGFAHAWNDRGLCFRELGDYDEALKSFIRAVELAPEDLEILFDLGETLEKIGAMRMDDQYFDAAVQTFNMVLDKLPDSASAWNHIGVCLKEMGKAEMAKTYFDRARDIRLWKKDRPIVRKREEYL